MRYNPTGFGEGTELSSQLIEECLGVLQIGGVKALGEPVVDYGEHRASLFATALRNEQPRKAGCCPQLV